MKLRVSPLKPEQVKKIYDIDGVYLSSINSGIKYKGRDDLLLITFSKNTNVAGIFTKSSTASAAVKWCKKNIKKNNARAIIINAGNANVFTGEDGKLAVQKIISKLALILEIKEKEVLIAQTGVIGEALDFDKIVNCLEKLKRKQKINNWFEGAQSIMTTDTFPKFSSSSYIFEGSEIFITGIAKGSGMIAPNMATMLSFISSNINISKNMLQNILEELSEESFNAISVDGDTSTSDSVILSSSGKSNNSLIKSVKDKHYIKFKSALLNIFKDLALQIVRDGEGASKFIRITVRGTSSKIVSKKIASSIANSPLVKTAIAAEDANWGRIIMAIGKTNLKVNLKKLKIYFGSHLITSNGQRIFDYNEEVISEYMKNNEIEIIVDFGKNQNETTVWTCDLTHKYIDINGNYRS